MNDAQPRHNLFVAGLPFDLSEAKLIKLFSASGSVLSARILAERESGRSRGIAFVLMSNEAEAQAAIKALHGSTVGQRQIVVTEARPKESAPGYTGPERRSGKDRRRQPPAAARPWEKRSGFGEKKPWEKKAGFGDKKSWEKKASGFEDRKPWEKKDAGGPKTWGAGGPGGGRKPGDSFSKPGGFKRKPGGGYRGR